jgi:hypothetical protein
LLVKENIARFDVAVDNLRFQPLVKIGQPGQANLSVRDREFDYHIHLRRALLRLSLAMMVPGKEYNS